MYSFRKLTRADFPLLFKWLGEDHIQKVWGERPDYANFEKEYVEKLNHEKIHLYIVELDEPFAFIQVYEAHRLEQGWWPHEQPGSFGLDTFIGESIYLGKGHSAYIKAFIPLLILKYNPHRIFVDPAPDNLRAIRAYEKAGFVKEKIITTPDGPAQILAINLKKPTTSP